MPKALQITPKIRAAIQKSTGDAEFDTNKVTVFETISLNTLPLNKRGLFNGARTSETTLMEMAQFVRNGGFVPLHTLHDQAYGLPVGRVFDAEVVMNESGNRELRSMFFIDNEHPKLVSGVDTGTIDEVSIGMQTKHLNCSQCGFDYLGEEASSDNVWNLTCNQDHVIGEAGTHVILNGMDRWLEQSLVSLGAANGAKIQSRTKSLLGAESYEKLAASGVTPEATVVFASLPLNPQKLELNMDMKELITLNASLTGEKAVALHENTTLKASVETLKTEKATLETKVADLTAQLAATPADAIQSKKDLETAKGELATSLAFVRKEADRLAVAAGAEKLPEAATLTELTASITANRDKLSESFGGKISVDAGSGEVTKAARPSSYKTA